MQKNKQQIDGQILLFDGVCNLCHGAVNFVIKHDRNFLFKFASLQSQKGEELLSSYGVENNLNTVVYIRNHKALLKSSAALYVLYDLGGLFRCFIVLIILPSFIRDFLYTLIAKNRYKIFGKKDSCMLPTKETASRFLD